MPKIRKVAAAAIVLLIFGFLLHQLSHYRKYGHLAPLKLHLDVSVTTSDNLLGVQGAAKIYKAKLSNFGVLPSSILACNSLVNGIPNTSLNYTVERWDHQRLGQ